jgi:hypothetical protein
MIDPQSHDGGDLLGVKLHRLSPERLRANTCSAVRGGFPFQRFSFVRHLAPTAGQIEVRYSKHIICFLSGAMATLVLPLPTFVSTVQHHCCHTTSVTVQDWSLTNGPNPMRGDSYALLRLSAARFTRANRDTCLQRRILGGRVIS